MGIFSDVLLTVDYDRTMTDPDSVVPLRNMEAIRYFMDNGGAFTLNTGRSTTTAKKLLNTLPVNAPMILYNGSACYENGKLVDYVPIELDMWETVMAVAEAFPELNVEIQALDNHYFVNAKEAFEAFYDRLGWGHARAYPGQDLGPFIKFAVFGEAEKYTLKSMYTGTPEQLARFAELEQFVSRRWGDKVEIYMPSPRILDVHAKGVSKGNAARRLQKKLGRKILVCVGDAANDIPMLDAADYAFCPADGVVAERYENVCPCTEGAVAEVIYEKIPEILKNQP
jgi:HAD superfamily hydrolase (TIGR01484 family)